MNLRQEFDAEHYEPIGAETASGAVAALEPRLHEMVEWLKRLVEIESPSDHGPGLQAMAHAIEERFSSLGRVERLPAQSAAGGPHLLVRVDGATDLPPALVLCHYDTVWPVGTLAEVPFRVDDTGIARGPACFDMKGGIVMLAFALEALRQTSRQPRRPLLALFTADEELGSTTSRPVIERLGSSAGVAYVLESPLPGGTLKTARKGTGDYLLRVKGRAAHAGVEPEKGINAIEELAHQILDVHRLGDPAAGTTVSVGVVRGGTRPNVVPAAAEAAIDVRVARLSEATRLDQAIRALRPHLAGAQVSVDGGLNRPPMERSESMGRLFARARAIAAGCGIADLREGGTGGGSDGNFTAALGVPTLDGLGPEGDGAHADHEHLVVPSFPRRAALLAGLLAEV